LAAARIAVSISTCCVDSDPLQMTLNMLASHSRPSTLSSLDGTGCGPTCSRSRRLNTFGPRARRARERNADPHDAGTWSLSRPHHEELTALALISAQRSLVREEPDSDGIGGYATSSQHRSPTLELQLRSQWTISYTAMACKQPTRHASVALYFRLQKQSVCPKDDIPNFERSLEC
jgi:hypothetical protein